MSADKQPKGPTLESLAAIERMKGREPTMTTLLGFLDKLLNGEKSDGAVRLLAEHGLPAMMLDAHQAGLLDSSHWETWKTRVGQIEANMVLATEESVEWPSEVREWAAVVAVSGR